MSKNIVCLGGGNAMPKVVLAGLKNNPEVNLSAISAMLDSGGSAGRERRVYNTNISFGDIRRSFLALSGATLDVTEAFEIRFEEGDYRGIVIANIFGTAIAHKTNDYEKAFRVYREVLKIPSQHKVLPVTLDSAHLCAVLENGKKINGEANIDIPKHDPNTRISKVFLKPKARAYPQSIGAIKNADLIVMGPGDLYSSLAQILLVDGITGAIRKSKAKKVYICNLMTKLGETNGFSVSDFGREIEKYLKGKVDYVIYNNKIPSPKRIKTYKKEHPELLEIVNFNKGLPGKKFIGDNLLLPSGPIIHDSQKIAKILLKLI